MLEGIMCKLTIALIYNYANLDIDILILTARKWALFVNMSTIT